MRAAWYERKGSAEEVLEVGEMLDPEPLSGEVRIRLRTSGINPGDIKKREGWLGFPMSDPRVIPHSDGAGEVDAVGDGVDKARVGERVWCYGAQSGRPFGTAAEYVVVPERLALPLPDGADFEQGACLGIPGITAHRAVFADGDMAGAVVLVAGAAGAVGSMAAQLASRAGATVIATVRDPGDVERVRGAREVLVADDGLAERVLARAPHGVDRVIEVALSANAQLDADVLAQGGTLVAYSSPDPEPLLPFWPLLFNNVTIRLLGSDDFPESAKEQAASDLVAAIEADSLRAEVGERFPLEEIAAAHLAVEQPRVPGRVLLDLA